MNIEENVAPEVTEPTDRPCDAWIDGAYCDKPVTVDSLCDGAQGRVTLGGFCSIEHAATRSRPPFDEAEYMFELLLQDYGYVCGGCGIDDEFVLAWRHLLDVYPEAVEAHQPRICISSRC